MRTLGSSLLLCALLLFVPLSMAAADAPDPAGLMRRPDEIPKIAPELLAKMSAARNAKRQSLQVRSRISKYLGAAAETSDAGNIEEGLALLERLNPKRLNPYERALVYRVEAFLDYSAGDVPGSIDAFQRVLDEEVLPLEDENEIRFNIAQLYGGMQQWPELVAAIHRWLPYVSDPSPSAYYLLAIAHYNLEQLDLALVCAETAIDLEEEPKESWLQLLAALYVKKSDYASAAPVLEELVMRFPKKQYWVQLSLIYGARDDYRHSLAVQQIAYAQGFLTKDGELRRLARSYLYHDLPHPAAQVLERGLEVGTIEPDAGAFELLANSLVAAREYDKSIEPLKRAAKLSDKGNLYVRLAQIYMQREEWEDAIRMLEKAVDKGGLDNPGNTQLLLGIAYYNDERVGPARSSFSRARQHAETRTAAEQWIEHIEKESGAG